MRPNVMPKAVYNVAKEQKRRICEWISHLKFSDGYASNLPWCVDMKELRLHSMKSHDCHVFMQKLISIAFCEMLPKPVWSALTKASLLFQIRCSMTLDVNKVQKLEGPEEMTTFMGKWCVKEEVASGSERHIIETYILGNCELVMPYYESFLNEHYEHHHPKDPTIEELVATQFKEWFKRRVYQKNELFILAQQVVQIYYMEYPSMKRDKIDWMVVCKTKARRVINDSRWTEVAFEEEEAIPTPQVVTDNHSYDLHDPNGIQLVLDLFGANQQGAGTSQTANGESDQTFVNILKITD
ncbi:UNVERIFIED_CONTAM: hypothetical protein Scaly_0990300 [Sesamum calycinum]|uniref:DUF4218 domain-containing protein n=1 Tax=Sesamum calycinum TaxID=2727403 RepID=A0AAW2QZ40_9LAMI